MIEKDKIYQGDCIDVMRSFEDNSIDTLITDSPYSLGFMGLNWDKFSSMGFLRFTYKWSKEALRILKPGAHLLNCSAPRKYHLMACGVELAGFKIKDMISWAYGCLSEDTEILTINGWELYHKNIHISPILCYDHEKKTFIFDRPRRVFIYQNKYPAYRIKSDFTDQIISRNHRCIVEREGDFVFRRAETLQSEENIPFLESLQDLPETIYNLQSHSSEKKQDLLKRVFIQENKRNQKKTTTFRKTQRIIKSYLFCMWKGILPKYKAFRKGKTTILFQTMQRSIKRRGMEKIWISWKERLDRGKYEKLSQENEWSKQSRLERWCHILQNTWKLYWSKICSMSKRILVYGSKGWVYNGTSFNYGSAFKSMSYSNRNNSSYKPRSFRQSFRKFKIISKQQRTQTIRRTKAKVEEIEYHGNIWCVEVSTGAFVARRNGKIFITGNSGIPKGPNLSVVIDKKLGVYELRKKIGIRYRHGGGTEEQYMGMTQNPEVEVTEPYSEEAKYWDGWGTGLKPAVECIIVAQKPKEGNYAENVLKHGVGGKNIDKCRVPYIREKETDSRIYNPEKNITRGTHDGATIRYAPDGNEYPMYNSPQGRWPSNLILSHHPECKLIGIKKAGSGNPRHNSKIPRKGLSEKGPFNSQNCGFDVNKGQGLGNYGTEIIEAYECHLECPIRLLDEQSGITETKPDYNYKYNKTNCNGNTFKKRGTYIPRADKGGASRYFYCAKVHPNERNAGCENFYWEIQGDEFKKITKKQYELLPKDKRATGNPIATLKPINLMRYLTRLVTPLGGTVLDPFSGSGTTGIACIIEGFHYILIEKRDAFVKYVIPKRLECWKDPKNWTKLKDHPLLPKIEVLKNKRQNQSLENWITNRVEVQEN